MSKSAYFRKDKGRPRAGYNRSISPEYAHYLARWTHTDTPRMSQEALHALLASKCALCGDVASKWRVGGVYCAACDPFVGVGGEQAVALLAKRVYPWRW